MKLSTRSRYGTRLILDMARHYDQRPVQLGEIAKRQNISLKYLEQIIRPLKKADYIKSFRGSKGGHMLNKSPAEITVGEIVALLEGRSSVTRCVENPETCDRVDQCLARFVWTEASKAMFEKLHSFTFADLLDLDRSVCSENLRQTSEQA
jgi:Rrf2 family iron-sulfur cluster assembly transcriptional regulator